MNLFFLLLTVLSTLFETSLATPTPTSNRVKRQDEVTSLLGEIGDILSSAAVAPAGDVTVASSIFSELLAAVEAATPTTTLTSIPEATSIISSIIAPSPSAGSFYESVVELIANDFVPNNLGQSLVNVVNGLGLIGPNSEVNVNVRGSSTTVYPQKQSTDAQYSQSEAQLRQSIFIPAGFTYGRKPPTILVPGTGNTGFETFSGNYIPLLTDVSYADPVWLNIPNQLLQDAQVNAEHVAYAINYISGISGGSNVSVIAWSQGGLNAQWAFKYWPSTRSVVSDFIAFSPDFHGTEIIYVLCPYFPELPCDPSAIQQEYNSAFINQLRQNGGDSAFVPTTTIFSSFDEIVQPQTGTGASAWMNDDQNVGVTNNELQVVCNAQPAGGIYDHVGTLVNALGYALAVDALTHDGPGDPSRLDLDSVCQQITTPGLSLAQIVNTESALVLAALFLLSYVSKQFDEPALMSYATY